MVRRHRATARVSSPDSELASSLAVAGRGGSGSAGDRSASGRGSHSAASHQNSCWQRLTADGREAMVSGRCCRQMRVALHDAWWSQFAIADYEFMICWLCHLQLSVKERDEGRGPYIANGDSASNYLKVLNTKLKRLSFDIFFREGQSPLAVVAVLRGFCCIIIFFLF